MRYSTCLSAVTLFSLPGKQNLTSPSSLANNIARFECCCSPKCTTMRSVDKPLIGRLLKKDIKEEFSTLFWHYTSEIFWKKNIQYKNDWFTLPELTKPKNPHDGALVKKTCICIMTHWKLLNFLLPSFLSITEDSIHSKPKKIALKTLKNEFHGDGT